MKTVIVQGNSGLGVSRWLPPFPGCLLQEGRTETGGRVWRQETTPGTWALSYRSRATLDRLIATDALDLVATLDHARVIPLELTNMSRVSGSTDIDELEPEDANGDVVVGYERNFGTGQLDKVKVKKDKDAKSVDLEAVQ